MVILVGDLSVIFFSKKLLHLWLQIFDYAICSEDRLEMLDTTTKRASLIQPPSVLRQLPLTKSAREGCC